LLARMPLIQLVKMALLGAGLVALGGLVCIGMQVWLIHAKIPEGLHGSWIFAGILVCAYFVPMVPGSVMVLAANGRIRAGLRTDAWKEQEIGVVQAWLTSEDMKRVVSRGGWVMGASALGWFIYCCLFLLHKQHPNPQPGFASFLLVPFTVLMKLREWLASYLSRPEPVAWAQRVKPIQSEHWGLAAEGTADGEPG
jgi:hypothetical protein